MKGAFPMNINDYIAENKDTLGIHQYAFLETSALVFSENVRQLCEMNSCGHYGKSWACPPGVGTYEECKNRILKYKNLFVFTTLHPLEDSYDFEGMMAGKEKHSRLCPDIAKVFAQNYSDLLVLSAEGCERCESCTYPDAPCRFPDTVFPSIESYCVEVNRLAASAGINYINGANTVTYFGCIFF